MNLWNDKLPSSLKKIEIVNIFLTATTTPTTTTTSTPASTTTATAASRLLISLFEMSTTINDSRYEGCGEEGPLRSIFFAEFHPTAGPIIRCQAPAKGPDLISKDIFDSIRYLLILFFVSTLRIISLISDHNVSSVSQT